MEESWGFRPKKLKKEPDVGKETKGDKETEEREKERKKKRKTGKETNA